MADSPRTLRSLFASAKAQRKALEAALSTSTPEYQENLVTAIASFAACRRLIEQASLFSKNETLDDITSGDLEYLLVDYYRAELELKRTIGVRRDVLLSSQGLYESFLERLHTYEILSLKDKKLYEQFLESRNRFALASSADATARRQTKVARYQEEKALKQKLEYLAQDPAALRNDDAPLRDLRLTEIGLYVHQTFQSLDLVSQELIMLASAPAVPLAPPGSIHDSRRNQIAKDGYSDKLDGPISQLLNGNRGGPLLSREGKPLQPFTLTDKRIQLQAGVFRPGHSLPTMSIDEYLEEEKRRGGIIEGGGEKSGQAPEVDEDDLDKADEETMKARAWDEYKEANPKGSGNTLNRG